MTAVEQTDDEMETIRPAGENPVPMTGAGLVGAVPAGDPAPVLGSVEAGDEVESELFKTVFEPGYHRDFPGGILSTTAPFERITELRGLRPHAIRLVREGTEANASPLLLVVRPGHEEEDEAALLVLLLLRKDGEADGPLLWSGIAYHTRLIAIAGG